MKSLVGTASLAVLLAAGLVACGGSDVSDPPQLLEGGIVMGVVTDLSGGALDGASVTLAGRQTETNGQGWFTVAGVPAGERVVVRASLDGYIDALRDDSPSSRARDDVDRDVHRAGPGDRDTSRALACAVASALADGHVPGARSLSTRPRAPDHRSRSRWRSRRSTTASRLTSRRSLVTSRSILPPSALRASGSTSP
ncbi:MAG: carboxypeptidase regulatory-like domain-containing protein [Sandaracinaceae bacterium]|nr:carboxypeptidase regulatory-like domain-containing protein [Sandaracinaceae bacterium]